MDSTIANDDTVYIYIYYAIVLKVHQKKKKVQEKKRKTINY